MKGKHHHAHTEHTHVKHHSMKHTRSHHAKGGATHHDEHGEAAHDDTPKEVYAGAGSHVVKEAAKKKRGGALKHLHAHGEHAKHRLDRPARRAGGRTGGADMHPFSSAHNVKSPAGRDVDAGES